MKRSTFIIVSMGALVLAGTLSASEAAQAGVVQIQAGGLNTPAPPGPPAAQSQVAQQAKPPAQVQSPTTGKPVTLAPSPVVPVPSVPQPPGFVIGPKDVLQILYAGEKDLSAEVVVRPDGMISLPLLNDVMAGGLTPEGLRLQIRELVKKFVRDEAGLEITVVVKQINSWTVFITGQINKPGEYPLTAPTSVMQLIAMAGGLTEFAKKKDIAVVRTENGRSVRLRFNYTDVMKGKNLRQNVDLKRGDIVIVP